MYRIVNYFRGYAQIRITGAAPERCLNALSAHGIIFWGIVREDALHYCIFVHKRQIEMVRRLAMREFCTAEVTAYHGFYAAYGRLLRRPVFLLGMLLAVLATFLLQRFVWAIEIEGNTELHDEQILHALETLDIRFGAWGPSIDSQHTKNQMLNIVPELQWLAVNRTGSVLHVLVAERRTPQEEQGTYSVANIVASCDGVLTEVSVLEGMRLCAVGDTVSKGQLLVSGYEDYGLCMRAVRASAEIYAMTWHSGTVVTPAQTMQKQYTGEEWTQYTLVVGRKRINLSGNSGIHAVNCDKMIDEQVLSLPGGYSLPLKLEKAVYRAYTLIPTDLDANSAGECLQAAWKRLTLGSMIAGQIKNTDSSVLLSGGVYAMHAESTCTELISRTVPMEDLE